VAFGTIYDPAAVQQATKAGVGATIEVSLGGHTDPSMGAPVKAKAIVKMLSDGNFRNDGPMNAGVETSMGPTAVLRVGGIDVVTISSRIQTIDLQVFLSQGIDPAAKSAGGEERAALPRRLRADRPRDRPRRFGRHLFARHQPVEIHQAAPADLAARRHQ
jgi:hypothetical protein